MKPTNFARYMSRYLIEFLPGVKGVSYNTIASKRDTYMLLMFNVKLRIKYEMESQTKCKVNFNYA
jgi:hypothetical protein